MRVFVYLCCFALLISCNTKKEVAPRFFSKVEIEPILKDSLLSIRAIEILNDGSLAFTANRNTIGLYNSKSKNLTVSKQEYETLEIEFRALAKTSTDVFVISVSNPGLIFKTGSKGAMELVYKESHKNVFYDALDFWNDKEGIAMGDPTDGCISIVITRDGGETWKKIPCENLPDAIEGEAAFAASDTNIAIMGDHTWIATGGLASRIMYSPDKGVTWEVFDTPIIQDKGTTGMYSIDFYDELNGFAIGGDYTSPEDKEANKIVTNDGGKNWQIVGKGEEPSYRSCVQYIPNRNGEELVSLGFKGIDFSNDGGYSWKRLSDEGFYTVRFLNDSVAYAAGRGRISKLTFRE